MNKAALREYSKLMQKKEKAKAKELARQQQIQEQQAEDKPEESVNEPAVDLAKTTKLVFFRQYNTYQALLEVHPKGSVNSDAIYSKVNNDVKSRIISFFFILHPLSGHCVLLTIPLLVQFFLQHNFQ